MSEIPPAAETASAIAAARDRMVAFAQNCSEERWQDAVLNGTGDPRAVGVVVDHVAHAYEYLGAFIRDIVRGAAPRIDNDVIDRVNADHADRAGDVSRESAIAHLSRSGDALVELVNSLTADQLQLMDGRVHRLAQIAVLHADNHRADLEAALAGAGQ